MPTEIVDWLAGDIEDIDELVEVAELVEVSGAVRVLDVINGNMEGIDVGIAKLGETGRVKVLRERNGAGGKDRDCWAGLAVITDGSDATWEKSGDRVLKLNGWVAWGIGIEVIRMEPPTVPLGGMRMTVSTSDGAGVSAKDAIWGMLGSKTWVDGGTGVEVIRMEPPTVPLGGIRMTVSTSEGAGVSANNGRMTSSGVEVGMVSEAMLGMLSADANVAALGFESKGFRLIRFFVLTLRPWRSIQRVSRADGRVMDSSSNTQDHGCHARSQQRANNN
jgi:hypothetical protein